MKYKASYGWWVANTRAFPLNAVSHIQQVLLLLNPYLSNTDGYLLNAGTVQDAFKRRTLFHPYRKHEK